MFKLIGYLAVAKIELFYNLISATNHLMQTETLQVILPVIKNIKDIFSSGYTKIKFRLAQLFHYLNQNINQIVAALLILYFVLLLISVVTSSRQLSTQPTFSTTSKSQLEFLGNANLKRQTTQQQKTEEEMKLIQQQISKCLQTNFPNIKEIDIPILTMICELIKRPSIKLQRSEQLNGSITQQEKVNQQKVEQTGQIIRANFIKNKLEIKYQQILKQFESEERNKNIENIIQFQQNKQQNEDKTLNFLSKQQRQIIVQSYFKKEEDGQAHYLEYISKNQRVKLEQTEQDSDIKAELTQKYKINNYQQINGLCIVVNTFNNAKYQQIVRTLNSIFNQRYEGYNVIIVDRFSTDNTLQIIQNYLKQNPTFAQFTKILKNKKIAEVQATLYGLKQCHKGDIAILMNGNSQLLTRQAFMLIDHFYQKRQTKVLYSDTYELDLNNKQIKLVKGSLYDISQKFMNLYRDLPIKYSSFFTFDTTLLKSLKKSYLINSYGGWFKYSANQALKITLLQLSCSKNYHFKEPIFLNQFDSKMDSALQINKKSDLRAISRKNKMNAC